MEWPTMPLVDKKKTETRKKKTNKKEAKSELAEKRSVAMIDVLCIERALSRLSHVYSSVTSIDRAAAQPAPNPSLPSSSSP